jgi:hypothetical protein
MSKGTPFSLALLLLFSAAIARGGEAAQELVLSMNVPPVDSARAGLRVVLLHPRGRVQLRGRTRSLRRAGCRSDGQAAVRRSRHDGAVVDQHRYKICADEISTVALTVPMRRVWTDEYTAGRRVLAVQK